MGVYLTCLSAASLSHCRHKNVEELQRIVRDQMCPNPADATRRCQPLPPGLRGCGTNAIYAVRSQFAWGPRNEPSPSLTETRCHFWKRLAVMLVVPNLERGTIRQIHGITVLCFIVSPRLIVGNGTSLYAKRTY